MELEGAPTHKLHWMFLLWFYFQRSYISFPFLSLIKKDDEANNDEYLFCHQKLLKLKTANQRILITYWLDERKKKNHTFLLQDDEIAAFFGFYIDCVDLCVLNFKCRIERFTAVKNNNSEISNAWHE